MFVNKYIYKTLKQNSCRAVHITMQMICFLIESNDYLLSTHAHRAWK